MLNHRKHVTSQIKMAEEPPPLPLFGDDDENIQKEDDDEDLFKSATEVMKINIHISRRNSYFVHFPCRSSSSRVSISVFLCLLLLASQQQDKFYLPHT